MTSGSPRGVYTNGAMLSNELCGLFAVPHGHRADVVQHSKKEGEQVGLEFLAEDVYRVVIQEGVVWVKEPARESLSQAGPRIESVMDKRIVVMLQTHHTRNCARCDDVALVCGDTADSGTSEYAPTRGKDKIDR